MSLHEFKLPDVGEGLRDGEIVKWHVAVGDAVKAHQVIVDVQTDKAIVEIPAPVTGTVVDLGGDAGDVLSVGQVLATFEAQGESDASEPSGRSLTEEQASAPAHSASLLGKPARVRASPAVRKLALELGVDLASVKGSGSRGQITRADVDKANCDQKSKVNPSKANTTVQREDVARPSGNDRVEPLRGLRRQIASTIE